MISPTTKSVVASLDVKVKDKVVLLDVSPSLTSDAVIAIDGIAPPSVMVQLSVAIIFALAAEAAEPVVYLLFPP